MQQDGPSTNRTPAPAGERGETSAAPAAVHVPPAGPPADLSVIERLEAFRDLIRHGNALLGEVVSYCREAEAAVAQLAAEKNDLDRIRDELKTAREHAETEGASARAAVAELETQRQELAAMRAELLQARREIDEFQRVQSSNADALERSLADARAQQKQLQEELARARSQAAAGRTLDKRLAEIDQMESKLRGTERELADTRRALEEERGRRDRAIALIRPKAAV